MRSAFLVEDNPSARSALISALAEAADTGVVGWAESEIDAIAWLEAHPGEADVVVLDLFLNAGSGLGVLARLKNLAGNHHIVVLTNCATSLLRRSCLLLGAEAVYDKAGDLELFFSHCRSIPIAPAEADPAAG
ncbi:MAG: response regulator [Pseudomonadota bacterium]